LFQRGFMNSESEVPSLYAEKARVGTCRPLQGPRRNHSCAAALFVARYDGSLGLRVGSHVGHGRPGGLSLVCCSSPGPPAAGARFLGHSGLFFVTVLRPRRGRPGPARWHAAVSTPRPPGPGRSRAPGVVVRRTAMGRDRSLRRSARLGWARRCMRDFNSIQQVCSDVRAHAALDCQCSRSP
jgi:hypothetical protein